MNQCFDTFVDIFNKHLASKELNERSKDCRVSVATGASLVVYFMHLNPDAVITLKNIKAFSKKCKKEISYAKLLGAKCVWTHEYGALYPERAFIETVADSIRHYAYHQRLNAFKQDLGGDVFNGTAKAGLAILKKHQPKKHDAIQDAYYFLEEWFNIKIVWDTITIIPVETHGRYGTGAGIGTTITLVGHQRRTKKQICYFYNQPPSAESGYRSLSYLDGPKVKFSQIETIYPPHKESKWYKHYLKGY